MPVIERPTCTAICLEREIAGKARASILIARKARNQIRARGGELTDKQREDLTQLVMRAIDKWELVADIIEEV